MGNRDWGKYQDVGNYINPCKNEALEATRLGEEDKRLAGEDKKPVRNSSSSSIGITIGEQQQQQHNSIAN